MKYSNENFEQKSKNLETIFMGDSYVYHGINGDCFDKDKFHNFGMGGENIDKTYFKLKYYLESHQLINLKKVFLNFESRHLPEKELEFVTNYSKFTNTTEYYKMLKEKETVNAYLANQSYLWRTRHAITSMKFKLNNREIISNFGQGIRDYQMTINELAYKNQLIKDETVYYLKPHWHYQIYYLKKIYSLCKKHEITLVIFQLPNIAQVDTSLIYPEQADIKDEYIVKWLKTQLNDIKVINLKMHPIDLTISDFFDSSHLNINGSKKVSEYLSNLNNE